MSPPSGKRPVAWGAAPEPLDADGDGSREDERRRARGAGGPSRTTLLFALVVELFGFWNVLHGLDVIHTARMMSNALAQTEQAMEGMRGIPGAPDLEEITGESLVRPMYVFGGLSLLAGAMYFAIGVAILLRHHFAVRPGATGLLAAAATFTSARVCAVWIGFRTIEAWEETVARAGPEAMRMFQESMADAGQELPTRTDHVLTAICWIVPALIVSVWGVRHLHQSDVQASLGH